MKQKSRVSVGPANLPGPEALTRLGGRASKGQRGPKRVTNWDMPAGYRPL